MASLTGQQIDQTYQGLIKTSANAAVSFPPASLEDGAGNTIGIKLGDGTGIGAGLITQIESNPGVAGTPSVSVDGNGVNITKLIALGANGGTAAITAGTGGQFDIFDGTFNFGAGFPGAPVTNVDFTNATVTGLPGGAAGLESGSATDSMQSSAALTTVAAQARGLKDIVLGDGANSKVDTSFGENIVIGHDAAQTSGEYSIAIGRNVTANGSTAIVIGSVATDGGSNSCILIGNQATTSSADEQIVIGLQASGNSNAGGIAIGRQASNSGLNGTVMGRSASAANNAIGLGYQTVASGNESVALGYSADATAAGAVALGDRALANIGNAVAIGSQVTSLWGNGTTVNQLAVANYANLNFADDSAASTGGVPLGGIYHTAGALKIRTT